MVLLLFSQYFLRYLDFFLDLDICTACSTGPIRTQSSIYKFLQISHIIYCNPNQKKTSLYKFITYSSNYFLIELMLKEITKFRFCADLERLKGAEAILKTIYEHEHPKILDEYQEVYQRYQKIQNGQHYNCEKEQGWMLSSKIQKVLKQMMQKNKIRVSVAEELNSIFKATKGIILPDSLMRYQEQGLLREKNQNSLFSINPTSTLMSFIMRQLYVKNQEGKFKINLNVARISHLVGASGFGKSFTFAAIKYLHDLKIPYIIKNEAPDDSLFSIHNKFFYFTACQSVRQIQQTNQIQLLKQFNKIPDKALQYFKEQENADKFLNSAIHAYFQKGIRIRIIVDQTHELYEKEANLRKEITLKWRKLFFQSGQCNPIIFISSINYPELSSQDPIKTIARSTKNNVYHKKTVLDNCMDVEKRLVYSIECLLFELEKNKISRDDSIKIINNQHLKIPLLTHCQIAKAIQKVLNKLKNEQKQMNTENIVERLTGEFSQSIIEYAQKLIQNYEDVLKKSTSQVMNENHSSFQIISNLLSFSCKQTIKNGYFAEIRVSGEDASPITIKKNIQIVKRLVAKNEENERIAHAFRTLKQPNFFFFNKDENMEQIYFSYSNQTLQQLRLAFIDLFDHNIMQKIDSKNPIEAMKLIGNNAREIFGLSICNLYGHTIDNKQIIKNRIKLGQKNEYTYMIKSEQTYVNYSSQQLKKLNLTHGSKLFLSCYASQSFDFLLSNFTTDAIELIFVNCTISHNTEEIIRMVRSFNRNMLLNNQQLFKSLDQIYQSGTRKIKLVFYILMANRKESKFIDQEQIKQLLMNEEVFTIQILQTKKKQLSNKLEQKKKYEQNLEAEKNKLQIEKRQPPSINYRIKKIQENIQMSKKHIQNLEKEIKDLQKNAKQFKIEKQNCSSFKKRFGQAFELKYIAGVFNKDFKIDEIEFSQEKRGKDSKRIDYAVRMHQQLLKYKGKQFQM